MSLPQVGAGAKKKKKKKAFFKKKRLMVVKERTFGEVRSYRKSPPRITKREGGSKGSAR